MPNRLKESRERLGFTQAQVAQFLKVPRETLSTWENDKHKPQGNVFERLAQFYQVPEGYLRGEEELAVDLDREVLYRGIPGNGEVKSQIEHWLNFLDQWASFLENTGQEVIAFKTPKRLDHGLIEDIRRAPTLAVEVREYYQLGLDAIANIPRFVDEMGILVYRASLGSYQLKGTDQISGACYNHPKLGCCILVNSDTTPGRQAFTLVHELAHALYHYSAKGITSVSGQASDPKERFANAFAGHFLVPGKALKQLIADQRHLQQLDPFKVVQLADHFRVSYATMLMRLREEKLITFDQQQDWKDYSPRNMARKLGFDPTPFEVPKSFHMETMERYPLSVLEGITLSLANEASTLSEVGDLLGVSEQELEQHLPILLTKATPEEIMEFDEMPF